MFEAGRQTEMCLAFAVLHWQKGHLCLDCPVLVHSVTAKTVTRPQG